MLDQTILTEERKSLVLFVLLPQPLCNRIHSSNLSFVSHATAITWITPGGRSGAARENMIAECARSGAQW